MSNYTELKDTVHGSEGKAFITLNGQNRVLFELSKISAQIDQTVISKRMLGKRMTQHKVAGAEGTGSMTMYFMNSEMLNLAIEYIKTGRHNGITITTINEDPQSSVGRQEVALRNVILKTIPVAILDDSSDDPITFDTDFTFDDLEPLKSFDRPTNYR